jgi:hypothetical protein
MTFGFVDQQCVVVNWTIEHRPLLLKGMRLCVVRCLVRFVGSFRWLSHHSRFYQDGTKCTYICIGICYLCWRQWTIQWFMPFTSNLWSMPEHHWMWLVCSFRYAGYAWMHTNIALCVGLKDIVLKLTLILLPRYKQVSAWELVVFLQVNSFVATLEDSGLLIVSKAKLKPVCSFNSFLLQAPSAQVRISCFIKHTTRIKVLIVLDWHCLYSERNLWFWLPELHRLPAVQEVWSDT